MREYLQSLAEAEFLNSKALWLIAVAALLIAAGLFVRRRSIASLLLRLCLVCLLILALADPIKREESTQRQIVAAIDVSASVPEGAQSALLGALEPYMEEKTTLFLLPFAARPDRRPIALDEKVDPRSTTAALASIAPGLDTGSTNIEAALTNLLASSAASSILLLSDGYETSGDARRAARAAAAKGAAIFPIIPDRSAFEEQGLSISSLDAPLAMDVGDLLPARVSLRNTLAEAVEAQLDLWLDDEKIHSERLKVGPGRERLVSVSSAAAKEGGLRRLRSVVSASHAGQNLRSEQHRWVSVKEKSKILLLSGTAEDERVLNPLLTMKGYELESIVTENQKQIPAILSPYSAVIFNNVARRQVPAAFLDTLKAYVANGGGLLLVGGERAFGLGEYVKTQLDEISPVQFLPPQTEKRRLNSAVILVLDKSGSMMHQDKILSAQRATLSALSSLKDDDYVGVIGFDAAPFVVIKLDPVKEVKPLAAHRLANLTAAGKTNLLPALAQARREFERVEASRKHILVLSDGKFPVSGNAYVEEIQRLRQAGISVSTIALGIEADIPFMKLLAQYGKGAFYHTMDAGNLPQIFMQDVHVAIGEKTMREREEIPVQVGPSGVLSTKLNSFPPLRGYVETKLKKEAALELTAQRNEQLSPILASWKYERGTVAAFTSDANGRWSLPWLRWDGFTRFWGELVESVRNKSSEQAGNIEFDLRYSVDQGSVLLDLAIYDEKLHSAAPPRIAARVTEPGGEIRQILFQQTKRGRFAAQIDGGKPGDYRIEISYGTLSLPQLGFALPGDLFGEKPGKGLALERLAEIASLSGGEVNPAPAKIAATERVEEKAKHLFLPLLISGFLLIIIEALVREIGLPSITQILRRRHKTEELSAKPRGRYEKRRKAG